MAQLKRIKIIGDGTSRGTKVIDAETGEKLHFLQCVEFSIETGSIGLVRVTQLCRLDEIDVDGWVPPAEIQSGPDLVRAAEREHVHERPNPAHGAPPVKGHNPVA